jgi:hypothetical protein
LVEHLAGFVAELSCFRTSSLKPEGVSFCRACT